MRSLLATLFLVSSAWAGNAAVSPFIGVNVDPGEALAATRVFETAYAEASGHRLVEVQASERGTSCPQSRAEVCVDGTITRLERKVIITVREVGASGKQLSSATAVGYSMDDLEVLLPRLARALASRQAYENTRTPDTVTAHEQQAPRRLRSSEHAGFRTGVWRSFVSGTDPSPSIEAGGNVRFERGRRFLELGAGFVIPTSEDEGLAYGGLFGELGVGYLLTPSDTAPFVAFAVSPRIMALAHCPPGDYCDADGSAGFGVIARVGVVLFRASESRLYAEAAVDQETIEISDTRPTTLRLLVGLAF